MTANEGQRRPMKCFFKLFFNVLCIYFIFVTQQPTTANEGQRRSTKANEGPRKVRCRSTKAHSGQRRPTTANAGQRRSTKAHSGQRRPTKANAGPHVLALHMFFFVFCSKLTILYKFYLAGRWPTQADKSPQQPMTANEGQRRPTKTKRGP